MNTAEIQEIFKRLEGTHARSLGEKIQNLYVGLLLSLAFPIGAACAEAIIHGWNTIKFTVLLWVAIAVSVAYWVGRAINHNKEYYEFHEDKIEVYRSKNKKAKIYSIVEMTDFGITFHHGCTIMKFSDHARNQVRIAWTKSMNEQFRR